MVTQLLPPMKRSTDSVKMHSMNDRLLQLLVKGALYEGCVDFCQAQAIGDIQSNIRDEFKEVKTKNVILLICIFFSFR